MRPINNNLKKNFTLAHVFNQPQSEYSRIKRK